MSAPSWFPDEIAIAGAEHLDPGYVPGYDAKSATDPTPDLARLVEHGLDGRSTLVDLGAGTGTFTLAAAPVAGKVIAVDVSAVMLDRLRERVATANLTNVETVNAGFLSYEHAGPPADVVYSRHALHHLPDTWKVIALSRIAAMLRPGGVFMLRDLVHSFSPAEAVDMFERWFERAAPTPDVGWTRAELETHVREEYSTFSWLLEPMLEHAGFRIIRADERESGYYATYTCLREG